MDAGKGAAAWDRPRFADLPPRALPHPTSKLERPDPRVDPLTVLSRPTGVDTRPIAAHWTAATQCGRPISPQTTGRDVGTA